MNMRLDYSYQTRLGIPGTLFDISPHAIDSRQNSETVLGAMTFGIGVMQGDSPGVNVRKPTTGDTLLVFEGLAMGSQTFDMNMQGELKVRPHQTVGVMRWGRAWARVASGLTIRYGDPVFLIIEGADAGKFTNIEGTNLAINAMFIGGLGTSDVAPIEIYNQKSE